MAAKKEILDLQEQIKALREEVRVARSNCDLREGDAHRRINEHEGNIHAHNDQKAVGEYERRFEQIKHITRQIVGTTIPDDWVHERKMYVIDAEARIRNAEKTVRKWEKRFLFVLSFWLAYLVGVVIFSLRIFHP